MSRRVEGDERLKRKSIKGGGIPQQRSEFAEKVWGLIGYG